MGSEMGNNNVSGIKEEEKAAVEVAEKEQEDFPEHEVKNHATPGDQTEDFHAEGEELSSNPLSAVNDLDAEKPESNEKEIGAKESKHDSQAQESSPESNNSISQECDIQKSDSPAEGNHVKPLESNLGGNIFSSDIPKIHDLPSIGKETEPKEYERIDSTDSQTTPQPSSNHSTISLEDCQYLWSEQSEEVTDVSDTRSLEEKDSAQEGIEGEHLDDLVKEETQTVEGELQETTINTEMCDSNSTKNKFGDGLEDQSDGRVPLKRNSIELSDSPAEVVLQYSSLDPSVATPEPQEKHVIRAEEIDLMSIKSEEGAQESDEINSPKQLVNDSIINESAPPVNLHDASSKENEKEVVQMTTRSGFENVHPNGEVKVTHKRSKSIMAGNKMCASIDQFEEIEEDVKVLPSTIASVSTQLSSTDKYDAEEMPAAKTSMEETEKREDASSSIAVNEDNRGTSEECILGSESFKREGSLLETSSESQLNSQNGNATSENCPEAAQDRKTCTTIDLEEFFVNGTSNLDEHKATTKTQASSSVSENFKPVPATNIQTNSALSAETEALADISNQQRPSGEMSHLVNGKIQEGSARLSIESNPGNPGNHLQRSKSPSFDFGLQLDVKSDDSDQTPLLHHDKTAARSFSGFANVRFQNRIIQTDYGRKSLDFEPVAVEEKTIRMERSDSDISRASFINLLKKDEKVANAQFSPKRQESPAASNNSEESSAEELALTSVKGSGKRKSRPSIFTSCICCTASVH